MGESMPCFGAPYGVPQRRWKLQARFWMAEFTRVRVLNPDYPFRSDFEFGLELILDRLGELHVSKG